MNSPEPKHKIQAKAVHDIALPPETYTADFEITDKYQAFSTELLRLSLLGLGGYGFIASDLVIGAPNANAAAATLRQYAVMLGIGVMSLGAATAFALAHRYFSTGCLTHQLRILRLLTRIKAPEWSNEDVKRMSAELAIERVEQLRDLRRCRLLIILSAVCLAIGAITVAIAFAGVLFRI